MSISSIADLRIGYTQEEETQTVCTMTLREEGVVGGVDQCGDAPGTHKADARHPMLLV